MYCLSLMILPLPITPQLDLGQDYIEIKTLIQVYFSVSPKAVVSI